MALKPFHFALMILLLTLLSPLNARALNIESVRFGLYEEKTRLVLDLDKPADFRAFVLSEPYRMVIDLPSFEWQAGKVQSPQDAGVQATRHGSLKPGISRIVFDLNRPISIQKAFTLPGGAGKPDRLVIDFSNVSPSLFEQIKSTVHGSLDPDRIQTQNANIATLAPPPPPKPQDQKPLIIIDPGHGGIDPGASGPHGLYEKNVVLALAKDLKVQLESSGKYRVKMTRADNHFIKLSNRVKFARKHGGDLFISLHADSMENKSITGASVYTLSEKASDAQTAKLAARENKADLIAGIDLSIEDEDVVGILMDLAMRDTMNQSKFFANTLVNSFNANGVKTLPRPHRYAGFAVLKAPDIPSVLIEAGFMSNEKEATLLNTSHHRQKIATALTKGIDRYFEQVRKNQRI